MIPELKTENAIYEVGYQIHSRAPMWLALTSALLLGISLQASPQQTGSSSRETELKRFFREYAGLKDDEIQAIQSGKAVAKVLESPAEQVVEFGAVYIHADPESYLAFATDIEQTRKIPGYLAIRNFSDPPQLSDLDTFSLEADDIQDLEECKPDKCEVQLPEGNIQEFQKSVNWKAADVTREVNALARQMALRALQGYIQGGNTALGTYRDKKNPNVVAKAFQMLLAQLKPLPVYMPDLHRYLLEYPRFKSPGIQSEFHWEKVQFGLKPTLRVVQKIVYRGEASKPAYAVAEKQLYSSHYFQTALDMTVCVKDSAAANQNGFYLITMKGSQQVFKGGGIVRSIAVGKSRSALEQGLNMIKNMLEQHQYHLQSAGRRILVKNAA